MNTAYSMYCLETESLLAEFPEKTVGSVMKMRVIFDNLKSAYANKDIPKVDSLRDEIDNIWKSRVALPNTLKASESLKYTIAMAQDILKSAA